MRGADLLHQAIDFPGRDTVMRQHAREDLDRRLELLRDDVVRTQPQQLGDLHHVPRTGDDVHAGIDPARDAHHAPRRGGVGDRGHEHAGPLDPQGA